MRAHAMCPYYYSIPKFSYQIGACFVTLYRALPEPPFFVQLFNVFSISGDYPNFLNVMSVFVRQISSPALFCLPYSVIA